MCNLIVQDLGSGNKTLRPILHYECLRNLILHYKIVTEIRHRCCERVNETDSSNKSSNA